MIANVYTTQTWHQFPGTLHKPVEMARDRRRTNIAGNRWTFHLPARRRPSHQPSYLSVAVSTASGWDHAESSAHCGCGSQGCMHQYISWTKYDSGNKHSL